MSPARLERLRFAALMHDVGKLVVPNHLLNKKGKLTAEEFAQVRMHEEVSVEILTRIDFLAPVAPSATSEAAEFAPVADDRGQPIEPHIVAVADAFDAMTSTRSYRKALTAGHRVRRAAQELRASSSTRVSSTRSSPRCDGAARCTARATRSTCTTRTRPRSGTGSAGLGDLLTDDENGSETGRRADDTRPARSSSSRCSARSRPAVAELVDPGGSTRGARGPRRRGRRRRALRAAPGTTRAAPAVVRGHPRARARRVARRVPRHGVRRGARGAACSGPSARRGTGSG